VEWIILRFQGFLKPWVLVGRVVEHQVQNNMDIAVVRFLEEKIKISQSAKFWIDILVIRDVVAKVHVRRRIDRRKPDPIDAQVFKVVQALRNARQVAYSVSIAILK